MNTWPRVVSDPLTELMEQLPLNAEGKQVHGKGADWLYKGGLLQTAQDDATRLTIHDQINAGSDVGCDGVSLSHRVCSRSL